jgi:(2Fe-2S) ferredoxin
MSYYEKHIFVCENIREPGKRVSCGLQDSKKIKDYLKLYIKEIAPEKNIRVNMSGCLDRCEEGPVQVSYPEGEWFCLKSESDVRIFTEHYIQKNDLEKIQDLRISNQKPSS